ncbi:MAG: nitrous oxide reductase accessory protein NosL [Algisphaera sp.]
MNSTTLTEIVSIAASRSRQIQMGLLGLFLACLAACGEPPTLKAPTVIWGQDVCVACGMILSDERYGAAVITLEHGERFVHLFDDVGEMLASKTRFATPSQRWVCDAQSKQWIDAETAFYVKDSQIHTPMGFGVAAFSNAAQAQIKRDEVDGALLRAIAFDSKP